MIYKTLIGIGIVLAGGIGLYNVNNVETYIAPEVEEIIEEVEEYPSDVLERARIAQEEVLHRYDLNIELDALRAESSELDARIVEIEKELGSYWTERANITRLIRDTFPEDPNTAVAIASCESGLNIEAYNPNNKNGTTDGGLWQINDVHNGTLQALGLDKYNPEDATEFARLLYDQRGGWGDWVCYTKGMIAMI